MLSVYMLGVVALLDLTSVYYYSDVLYQGREFLLNGKAQYG